MRNQPGETAVTAVVRSIAVGDIIVGREMQSVHAVGVGETGTRHVPINQQCWSEPYLSTDRRTTYRPSRIQAYPLHRILSHYAVRRCRSSISYYLVLILLWYSCHGQDNGTATINVAYEDEHHHVAPCHLYPAVVHYIKKGHIFQTARCTLINPTDSIASVTYNGAQFWKQRSKALTRPASHTLPTSPSL